MINSNFIKKIFNVEGDKLTLTDLKDYFSTPQEETSILEFKSGEVDIIDLYKEITAFLNTEGGLLIVGTPREKKGKNGKNEKVICQGDLTYSKFKNKDWIYQKIASNITPTPTNLKIEEFITDAGAIFLIDVPQSLNPPHQSSADGKYYIRLEREAKPAPHGIVQALFDKRRVPKLTGKVTIKKIDERTDNLYVSIHNESTIPADKVSFIIDIYNIADIESKFTFRFIKDVLGDKFVLSDKTDQILVQVISIPINAKIMHKGEEYAIMVGYWCKDLDFYAKFGIYNPETEIFTQKGTFENDLELFTKELDRIKEL